MDLCRYFWKPTSPDKTNSCTLGIVESFTTHALRFSRGFFCTRNPSKAYKDGKRLGMKGTCKCEPTACKCGRKRQQQQQQQQQQLKLLLSQLRRRDNLSSVILF
ncbi:Hypothetical predicted protein [Drosophila guanche]|uniref:Uncharacterized protein n=1 Tax=Drosophila guanche TaxID=7266 RepID=A0A3B0JZY3_DROGU|nr:Hypothetical predicted protein [Drosophila guanche]